MDIGEYQTMNPYNPPFTLSPAILRLVEEIGEALGRLRQAEGVTVSPQLRRENRIRTIQGSLAIEGNTLALEQVSDILDGKQVIGSPREIQEVRNAISAYEKIGDWLPTLRNHILEAHCTMMSGLMDNPGTFRMGSVGIRKGDMVVHVAPKANLVPALMDSLLHWLAETDHHPLVAGCVFHYELEFIHPFADGNGRMGRLWQTSILYRWKQVFAYLPLESVVRDRQQDYYKALGQADKEADATVFIEFMLTALRDACLQVANSDQASDYVSDQVRAVLRALLSSEMTATQLMKTLVLSHRPTFRKNYLRPALDAGWIEMTNPQSPRSPAQRYRITGSGRLKTISSTE